MSLPRPTTALGGPCPRPQAGPHSPLWKGSQGEQEGNWGPGGHWAPDMCAEPQGAQASEAVGRWALGTGLSRGGLQAQRFWNASGQGVLMGVRGQGLCWFEAGKLTVKFHCCLREGAHAVPSAPIHMPRGHPPPSPRWPPGMARGPPPQPYSLHSTFPSPRPLPGRCDPPPPPTHKAEPPPASCRSQLGGGHRGRGASALTPTPPGSSSC